jgi:signal transduction histidine kinase
MEISRRSTFIYALLFALWVLILGWQVVEHSRVKEAARAELIYRAKDISTTLGIVLRSQRRFGGVVSKERLESAMNDLIRPGELTGIALLNATGDVVASAGTLVGAPTKEINGPTERWDEQTATLMNLVDLGTNVTRDIEGTNPPIIMSREDFFRPSDTNRTATNQSFSPPPDHEPPGPPPEMFALRTNEAGEVSTNRWRGRTRFGRPRGMSDEEFKAITAKQGVHSFLMVLSAQSVRALIKRDLWLRSIIGLLATVSVIGSGLAWRNLSKSSDLQIRLIRASELNTHLKEMNLAAAGLAHETRNPLNIIRGMAQMISKQPDAPVEIKDKSRAIVDETDKVTAQLNEFINYSRPREIRRSALPLNSAVNEVVRALSYDLEEKKVKLEVKGDALTIEADEQLLRQALFNLLLNAIQAIGMGGEIQVVARKQNASEAILEVCDNGPGVPPERRQEIFKPYFTTHQKGTGLGLAVVSQIVLAHGWEIECLANEPQGAVFRIKHLRIVE